jgi:hypothetical protein
VSHTSFDPELGNLQSTFMVSVNPGTIQSHSGQCFCTLHVTDIGLRVLHVSSHVFLTTLLWARYYNLHLYIAHGKTGTESLCNFSKVKWILGVIAGI